MNATLSNKVCQYIIDNLRSNYKSNYEFAAAASIDEKTVRLMIQGECNLSLATFKKICDSQDMKMSTILLAIGE